MSHAQSPQFTAIAGQLATLMPTDGVPEDGVAQAIRATLYDARDRGILDQVLPMIREQAKGNPTILAIVEELSATV